MKYTQSVQEGTGFLALSVPGPLLEAVNTGKVLIVSTFGRRGADVRVRFTDPDVCHLFVDVDTALTMLSVGSIPYSQNEVDTLSSPRPEDVDPAVISSSLPSGSHIRKSAIAGLQAGRSIAGYESLVSEAGRSGQSTSPVKPSPVGTARILTVQARDRTVDALREVISPENPDYNVAVSASSNEKADPTAHRVTLAQAQEIVQSRGLDRNRKQGVLNVFSPTSLSPEEFKRTDIQDLYVRALLVASAISNPRLVGRIVSMPEMQIPGTTTVAEWWLRADREQRFKALTEAKRFGNAKVDKARLLLIPCPFQDAGLSA